MFVRKFENWLLDVPVKSADTAEQPDLTKTIAQLESDHHGFMAVFDPDSENILIGGTDERQLENSIKLLKKSVSYEIEVGAPRVAYRETIRKSASAEFCFKPRAKNSDRFVLVALAVEPLSDSYDYVIDDTVLNDDVPAEYSLAIEECLRGPLAYGVLSRFPLIGLRATVTKIARSDPALGGAAFRNPTQRAFSEALGKAAPIIVEPIMRMEVVTPEDYLGDILGDLISRRGGITNMAEGESDKDPTVDANVPLANMFGYANSLSTTTHGSGSYSIQFSHYEQIPSGPDNGTPPEAGASALRA
jgi:elongation factor G